MTPENPEILGPGGGDDLYQDLSWK